MSESEHSSSRQSRGGLMIAVVAILFLLAYPLALGPLAWMVDNGVLGDRSGPIVSGLEAVYTPLRWVYDRVGFVKTVLDWYLAFWGA